MKTVSTYVVCWALTLVLVSAFYVPRVSEKGSFIDSLVYTTISHNLAVGTGTFWKPVLKNAEFLFYKEDIFYDHPPLMFGMLSVFYDVFGDHADWIYTTLVLSLLFVAVLLLFSLFLPESRHTLYYGFIPLFLFFTLPECTKKIAYPLLDTTLALFTSFAVYFLCRAMHYGRHFLLWTMLGGIFIILGILTKGPVGLFPLITPVFYYMVYRNPAVFRKMFYAMGILTIVLVAAISILYMYTPSRLFFTEYLQHQVVASIKGEREKASTFLNHFSILVKLVTQLLPMIVITIIVSLFTPKDRSKRMILTARPFLFFMGIGLAASLPIAISAKHHTFYLIPSFVFFTLAFSYFISNLIPAGTLASKKRSNNIILFILVTAITTIFILSLTREKRYYKKHQAFLIQLEEMAPWLSSTKCLGTSEALLHQRGDICCYMERYFQIELLPYTDKCDFYLAFDTDSLPVIDARLMTQTHGFKLYTIP